MNDRALSVVLTFLLVVSSISAAGVGMVSANTGNTDSTTFHVMQNGKCQEFAPIGNGSQSVEDFYDYRSNETSPEGKWSSYGTGEYQKNQASNLFVYDGTNGYSLVVLHDELSETGDAPHASTITFTLENMSGGEWVVRDDTYANDTQDDDWETSSSTHTIDWKWGPNRTDGGAFLGVGDANITITPGFNEDAAHWGNWPFSEGDHRMEEWRLLGEGGTNVSSLNMSQQLSIAKGSCSDGGDEDTTSPNADLTANPNTVANDEAVTLDASNSSDDDGGSGIAEYQWDFTGDGTVDTTTENATVNHTYESPGNYTASVTVVDGNGNNATATANVEVTDGTEPRVIVKIPETVNVSEEFEVVANASDESKIESYEWDFGDATKTGPRATHSYDQAGTRNVTLTWHETDGETDTGNFTVDVMGDQSESNITFINATAVEVEGSYDSVRLDVGFYDETGYGNVKPGATNVSGTTLIEVEDQGVNGSVINTVELFNDSVSVEEKQHPRLDHYAETIKPYPVTVSVENVTETSNGTYEVTFGYDNPNEETLDMRNSTLSGNVSGEAPELVQSGTNTFTVTWTPDSDEERATWTLNRTNFGQEAVSASTQQAGNISDGSGQDRIEFINESAVEVAANGDDVILQTEWYNPTGLANERIDLTNVSGTIVYTPEREGLNGTAITSAGIDEDGDHFPDYKKNNPYDYRETIKPYPVTVSVENVTETGNGTYDVTFGYENPNGDRLIMQNSTLSGNVTGDAPEEVQPGNHTFTVTWTPDSDEERATWTLNRTNFDQEAVSASTQQAGNVSDGSDTTSPEADLTATPTEGFGETEFAFDASNSADDEGVTQYRWDFDADGEYETTTETPEINRTYSEVGDHEVTVEVSDAAGNNDTASATVTVYEVRSGPDIEFINETAVEVTGEFEAVELSMTYYTPEGEQTTVYGLNENVSNTTVVTVPVEDMWGPDEVIWGPVVETADAYENGSDDEPSLSADNPDFEAQLAEVRPDEISTFVEDATEVENGTYEVTFGYENPNNETMVGASAFTAGNASSEPPTEFEPGRNTFTVTWTPEHNDSNLVWETDLSNFGYGASTATSPTPDQIDEGEMPPKAKLTTDRSSAEPGEPVTFDASGSSADGEIVEYRWDFDNDGTVDRTTETPTVAKSFNETGDERVVVTVVDDSGQTATASATVTVCEKSDEQPTARLSADETGQLSQPFSFDASASSDDDSVDWWQWDFDSDGEVEWKSPEGKTSMMPYKHVEGPGTYTATVTVIDSSGQTDTATVEYTVEKVPPQAAIQASSDTVEVGEEVTFTATEFSEAPDSLNHICWKVGGEQGPDGQTWTTSFEESGQKTIELVLRDSAGHETVVEHEITVTAADDGGNDGDDGNDGNHGNDGNDGGGLPPSDDDDHSQDDDTVSAPLNGEDAEMGKIALMPAADANPALEVSQTAPSNVEAPSVADDGFEALSYVTVADADRATVTVSKDRLDAAGATADDVTLFRYEDGAWTAVETEQVGETADAYRFSADATNATYAIGIDRPATSVTDLSVESQRVQPGDAVTVVATVANDGRADGTREVQLTVGGDVVATETVEVGAGETAEVSLSHTFEDSGVYDVSVAGEQAEIVVEGIDTQTTEDSDEVETSTATTTTSNDGGIPGFGVGVSLVALLGAALLALRRQ